MTQLQQDFVRSLRLLNPLESEPAIDPVTRRFNEEKDRVQEIIIYRFVIMLFNTGDLNERQRAEVMAWIAARSR
jgi:hypothetical protein